MLRKIIIGTRAEAETMLAFVDQAWNDDEDREFLFIHASEDKESAEWYVECEVLNEDMVDDHDYPLYAARLLDRFEFTVHNA